MKGIWYKRTAIPDIPETTWVFPKIVVPPNHPLKNRVFHYKPSILGGFTPIFGNTHMSKYKTTMYSSCLFCYSFAISLLFPATKGNSKAGLCGTCNKRIDECVGHFGHVSLALPVFHAGFMRRDWARSRSL